MEILNLLKFLGKMHFDGITLMQDLLENEGVEIKGNQIVDLEKYLWEPKI